MANVAKKLTAWVPVIIASTDLLDRLWKTLNKDGRVAEAADRLFTKIRTATATRDPIVRIATQIDAIEEYLGQATEDREQVGVWRVRATQARKRLRLASAMRGAQRRANLSALEHEVSALFSGIIHVGKVETAEMINAEGPDPG